jgi:hypothetical protein
LLFDAHSPFDFSLLRPTSASEKKVAKPFSVSALLAPSTP